jgi:hypothetical protein
VRTAKTIVAGILVAACMIAYHGHMQGAAGAMPELFTQFIESF